MTARLTSVALFVAAAAVAGLGAAPFQHQHGDVAAAPQNPEAQEPAPASGMAAMMKMHDQMMAETRATDARLDALVKDMNSATGNAKVDAVTAVVNELARQNKAAHERMGQMHQQMMGPAR